MGGWRNGRRVPLSGIILKRSWRFIHDPEPAEGEG